MCKWKYQPYWNQHLRLALLFRKSAQGISNLMPDTPVTFYLCMKETQNLDLMPCPKIEKIWH